MLLLSPWFRVNIVMFVGQVAIISAQPEFSVPLSQRMDFSDAFMSMMPISVTS